MNHMMASVRRVDQTHWGIGFLVLAVVSLSAGPAFGQATNEITLVEPNSAAQGTIGLLVTFTLDTDAPPAPPAGALPDSVTIGSLAGTSVTRSSQYAVTAVFNIPAGEPTGPKDATVTFTTPQSQTVPPGSSVTLTVLASGTEPLDYQWQMDGGDISGATDTSYTINPVSESDAGGYRCVVDNDFGTATSNEAVLTVAELPTGAYPVVDTGQDVCYDDLAEITCPAMGETFHGQDAQYHGNIPSYSLSGDGLTVYDNVTGLTWTQDPDLDGDGDIDVDDKRTFDEAQSYPDILNAQTYGGYSDWRVPTIKELYSLMDFRGTDPLLEQTDTTGLIPFIDTDYFAFGAAAARRCRSRMRITPAARMAATSSRRCSGWKPAGSVGSNR